MQSILVHGLSATLLFHTAFQGPVGDAGPFHPPIVPSALYDVAWQSLGVGKAGGIYIPKSLLWRLRLDVALCRYLFLPGCIKQQKPRRRDPDSCNVPDLRTFQQHSGSRMALTAGTWPCRMPKRKLMLRSLIRGTSHAKCFLIRVQRVIRPGRLRLGIR